MSDQSDSPTKSEEGNRAENAPEVGGATTRRGGSSGNGGRNPAAAAASRRRRTTGGGGGDEGSESGGRAASPALNFEELRELIELFAANGLTEFELERESFRVHLKKDLANSSPAGGEMRQPQQAPIAPPTFVAPPAAVSTSAAQSVAPASSAAPAPPADSDDNLLIITAPIVGTFYRSASPTAEVFVKAGSRVEPDTVVCIIEAMKLMNEIQAETSGEIVKVFVENGQPVEYGQKLFGVKR